MKKMLRAVAVLSLGATITFAACGKNTGTAADSAASSVTSEAASSVESEAQETPAPTEAPTPEPTETPTTEPAEEETVGLPNPWTETNDSTEAMSNSDIWAELPAQPLGRMELTNYRYTSDTLEAHYEGVNDELAIRISPEHEGDDLSGDYNSYDWVGSFALADVSVNFDGVTVNCKGYDEERIHIATFDDVDGMHFAINYTPWGGEVGITQDDIRAMIADLEAHSYVGMTTGDGENAYDATADDAGPYAGTYLEPLPGRGEMTISGPPENSTVEANWGNSANETVFWTFSGSFDENGTLEYTDCTLRVETYEEVGDQEIDMTEEVKYTNGTGRITVADGTMTWVADNDPYLTSEIVFERAEYE